MNPKFPIDESRNVTPSLTGARVIFLLGPLELGGAERQALLFAKYLHDEHHADVEIWGDERPGRIVELCEQYGIRWRLVSTPLPWSNRRFTQLKRLLKFAWTLRRAQPDVVLPYMFFQSVVCGLVWRFSSAKVSVWNQRCEGRDRLGPRVERLAVRLTPAFIANSEHGAEFLVRTLGVPPRKVRVVHNGVDAGPRVTSRTNWRNRLGVSEDCFLACMVANLQQFKDHVTLLKAWRIVVDRLSAVNRQAVLLLAGRFDETHESLKALAFDLELDDRVRFLGQVKDVAELLGAVDLGVHSSVKEGCPNGVLECMAAGLAVAGTDYPGIREAVGPRGFPYLAAPGDYEALAEKILMLALDDQQRRQVGAANLQRIATEFHPQKMFDQTLEVIYQAMNRKIRPNSISAVTNVAPSRQIGSEL